MTAPTAGRLRIVADENMPGLTTLFNDIGSLTALPGRSITRQDLLQADVLLVRSITRVNQALLEGTPVKFVGSATIGTDHLDIPWLNNNHITHTNAPGCNADSVADYVIAALAHLSHQDGSNWFTNKTAAVIGAGNVGSKVVQRLRGLGLHVLVNDPPRQQQHPTDDPHFVDLNTALSADIICCHTPLVRSGDFPTYHLLDEPQISAIRPGTLLLNAGRGDVINNQALLERMQRQNDLELVLDVWENEPRPLLGLIPYTRISTPHIAGYSLDGRLRGSWMIYQALCKFVGIQPTVSFDQLVPEPTIRAVSCSTSISLPECFNLIPLALDVSREDQRFRRTLSTAEAGELASAFDTLRKTYPLSRELRQLQVKVDKQTTATYNKLTSSQQSQPDAAETTKLLHALGFSITE
ncbi:erythronate-4-phosphate dehydrogenase [Pokkaliibacter plantistimulans]|uniref:Erythronate-4-phosphate dehydrogenase n=1 Tax=Proteobacteria bacterium 228 TaxID=2083153 RepID=A0A2S5KR01_9PROT|nr:4-phosphoerythronate dehydrogenase [Pokkaliibacter plantistimulans]PPC77284.1 erythronate-4-phosphate dehydrogenase [Pokkaliibacter plantistimulans]